MILRKHTCIAWSEFLHFPQVETKKLYSATYNIDLNIMNYQGNQLSKKNKL